MKIIDIYFAITILCATLQVLLTIRCIKYIKRTYGSTVRSNIVVKHLLKDCIENILKCCIPIYNIIIILGLFIMVFIDDVKNNLVSMGFLFKDCKFK